ncbi:MAG: ABC transporter ATP-binding protein [Chloroherpetonaceae bacterium]|nr:ABC transporter ATP-binding protein [Chloroherpetonaceae bacterium]
MPIVRLCDVVKIYNEKTAPVFALSGASLSIERGEFVALMGSSGSGKTTLLNILAAIDKPTSGVAEIDGASVAEMTEKELVAFRREKIGVVFQFFNLMPTLTALENVMLPSLLARKDSKRSEARAKELIERVGLSRRLHHKPFEMSGGEMQRIAIARALMNDPAIVIADEPTGNLDSKNAEQVLALLRALAEEERKTFIVATHAKDVAEVADRTILLRDGKVVEETIVAEKF